MVEVLGLAEEHVSGELILVGTIADITDKKQQELGEQTDRERLDVALAGSEASTFDWFPDTNFIHWDGVLPFAPTAEQMSRVVA